MSEVNVEKGDGWAQVILNRPERKNAINGPLGLELRDAFETLNMDDEVRVILFRGAEGSFCSGLDLKSFNESPEPQWVGDFQQIWRGAHRAIFNCKKPVVGALERFAINGGAALAIACDLLVVGRESFIQVGEAQIGMAAPYNLAWLSLRHPESIIARVALIGDRIYGEEMKSFGLAHVCCDDSQVLIEAKNLVAKLAAYPEHGLNRIKTVMRDAQGLGADDWFDRYTGADPVKERTKPSRVD